MHGLVQNVQNTIGNPVWNSISHNAMHISFTYTCQSATQLSQDALTCPFLALATCICTCPLLIPTIPLSCAWQGGGVFGVISRIASHDCVGCQ